MSHTDAGRWLTARGLAYQVAVAALVVVTAAVWGRHAALSVLGGASIVWVTNLYISIRARVAERTLGAALQRVMVGELIKVIGTIALFMVAARVPHLVWPGLLCGFVIALVATWLAAAITANRGWAEFIPARDDDNQGWES
jgi:F0F1-type ATP synthase assembly protein I